MFESKRKRIIKDIKKSVLEVLEDNGLDADQISVLEADMDQAEERAEKIINAKRKGVCLGCGQVHEFNAEEAIESNKFMTMAIAELAGIEPKELAAKIGDQFRKQKRSSVSKYNDELIEELIKVRDKIKKEKEEDD